ncbi:MAG: glycosyltransferase family 4 protein [Candidatus Woykebacteria bacterium]
MNILFVLNNSINYGGSERYVNTLSSAFVEKGHKVVVISTKGPLVDYLDERVIHEEIDPVLIPTEVDLVKIATVIKKACKKYQIDVVHCNSLVDFRAAILIKKEINLPFIYTAHLVEELVGFPILGSEFNLAADRVITVSNFIKHHLINTGLSTKKISQIYHGVDTHKFNGGTASQALKTSLGIKNGEKILMSVSRLYPIKGINFAIEALKLVLKGRNNIKIVFVGEGPYKDEYKNLAVKLGVEDNVLFLGRHKNVEELLSLADIFCLPSLMESLSFAILEAMSKGKPVVATKVGGIPEVVSDKETGLLVSSGNTKELAEAINKLLGDPELARRLSRNGKERVKDLFRVERMVEETLFAYERVLKKERIYA